MSVIQVDALSKHYGHVKALENANFTVDSGITGLIGPNGAGKSTLIKIMLGLVRQTKGKAEIFGLDSRKERNKVMRRVGVLHEKPSLPPWVSARQYLEFVASLKKVSDIAGEIERVSEICGLKGYVERRIGTFSAGMAQRLGLAGALVGEPDLVVLDEPTANLDPLGRYEILTKIKGLRDQTGTNFLISTHILSELEKVCDNIIILNEGTVLTHGPFSKLVKEYSGQKYMVRVDKPRMFLDSLSEKTARTAEIKNDSILLEVNNEEQFLKEANEIIWSKACMLKEFKPLSPTLEDVFIEVMRRKQVD